MSAWFTLDSPWSVRLLIVLAHFVWQGALIGLAAWIGGALLRNANAKWRYGVYTSALVVMALCLPVTYMLVESGEGWAARGKSDPQDFAAVGENPNGDPYAAAAAAIMFYDAQLVEEPPSLGAALLLYIPSALKTHRFYESLWLFWHLGFALLLARLFAGLALTRRMGSHSHPVAEAEIQGALSDQAAALGISRLPKIARCGRAVVPMVVGVFRPMILLPLWFGTGMTPEQVRMVLCHELPHIQRFDPVVNLSQRVMETVLFYHPAVWFISRRIRFERELCCDDVLVRIHRAPRAYAESLVEHAAEKGAGGHRARPPWAQRNVTRT